MSIINNKTNPNTRYRIAYSGSFGQQEHGDVIIKGVIDNFNVSKPIPASDHGYAWITGSLEQTQTVSLSLLDGAFYLEGGVQDVEGAVS